MSPVTAFRIAVRNILQNRKRSLAFAATLFLSCFLLLVSASLFNGEGDRIRQDMTELITGEVGIFWSSILEYEPDDQMRPFGSEFDVDRDDENLAAIATASAWLDGRDESIESRSAYLLGNATAYSASKTDRCMVYGVQSANLTRLLSEGVLEPVDGTVPSTADYGLLISGEYADAAGLSVGDTVTLEAGTVFGSRNALEGRVAAVLRNKAPWINGIVFCSEEFARELYDIPAPYFTALKIILKDGTDAEAFAREARGMLSSGSGVLTAETALSAGHMFMTLAESQKSVMTFMCVIMMIVIGIGLRSTTRMVLFQRMKEFGTLRAVGFSRAQCFATIMLETLILGTASLGAAVVCSCTVMAVLGASGIPIPPGPLRYMFAGELLFPRLAPGDVLFGALLIAALAFAAPFKPAGILLYNGISDLLAGRQKRLSPLLRLARSVFSRPGAIAAVLFFLSVFPALPQEDPPVSVSGTAEFGATLTLPDTSHRLYPDSGSETDWSVLGRIEPSVSIIPGGPWSILLRGAVETRDASWRNLGGSLLEAACSVDPVDFLHLDLGKKRLEWGRAQFRNPADFFQLPVNPADPRSGKDAVPLFHAAVLIPYFTADALATFGEELGDTGIGGRLALSGLIPLTDVSLLGYYSERKKACAGAVFETTPLSETEFLPDLTLYAEAGWTRLPDERDAELCAGLRFSLPFLDTMVLAEYLYRSEGLAKDELEALASTGAAGTDPSAASRHNLYLTVVQPSFSTDFNRFTDTLSASCTVLSSLEDFSCLFRFRLESSFIENFAVRLEATAFAGNESGLWRALPVGSVFAAGFVASF